MNLQMKMSRYLLFSHESSVCQCFVYLTIFFSPRLNILQIIFFFSTALTYFKLSLTFGFLFPLLNSVPPLHPNFSSQSLSSQQESNRTETQTFTIRINRVVRFLQTVHDSPHIAKSTLKKIVSKVGFADTLNS